MKKLVYFFVGVAMSVGSINAANAQNFTTGNNNSDTATGYVQGGSTDVTVSNGIKSANTAPLYIKWTCGASSLPSGVILQFCDNNLCRTGSGLTAGNVYVSNAYNNSSFGAFYADFVNMSSAPNGSHAYFMVKAEDTVNHVTRNLVFNAYKNSVGITTTTVADDNVMLYPNPARDAINVLYSPYAGVKNIAIYNLIGRAVKMFRPLDDNGAKLDIDNIPTGVYFVRLMDATGHVVATRRFTRQ